MYHFISTDFDRTPVTYLMDDSIHFEVAPEINVTIFSMKLKLYLAWNTKMIFLKRCSKLPFSVVEKYDGLRRDTVFPRK